MGKQISMFSQKLMASFVMDESSSLQSVLSATNATGWVTASFAVSGLPNPSPSESLYQILTLAEHVLSVAWENRQYNNEHMRDGQRLKAKAKGLILLHSTQLHYCLMRLHQLIPRQKEFETHHGCNHQKWGQCPNHNLNLPLQQDSDKSRQYQLYHVAPLGKWN